VALSLMLRSCKVHRRYDNCIRIRVRPTKRVGGP
jgi:hypothetical protein